MLIPYTGYCFLGYILISLIFLLCTGYVYRVNSKPTADDPEKRDYHPAAVPMVVAWPLYLIGWASLFVLQALAYGLFLIIFTEVLVAFGKPFLFIWLNKIGTKIGTMFFKANTFLIRAFFPRPTTQKVY